MRGVLIVSPHFPPVNAPDYQRVRMALPYLEERGWKATVLAVDPRRVEGFRDEMLAKALPSDIEVVRTPAIDLSLTRPFGFGGLGYRAMGALRRAGDELLRSGRFDLVFFSTTVFPTMRLGPRWRDAFAVPYVLDFQDPWLSDYYTSRAGARPPGGWIKYSASRWLAQRQEPPAVRNASGIVSVSPSYGPMLRARYPEVPEDSFTTLPFGAPEADFLLLPKLGVTQRLFDPSDGLKHWVYVGRAGADMAFSLRAMFTALRRQLAIDPELRGRVRLHFAGTDYAPPGRGTKTVAPLAAECGVSDLVDEQTDRMPYFEALRCLCDADALIVPGSDDPSYTASKIYPYVLARKPLLAVFHRSSSVTDLIGKTRSGTLVTFEDGLDLEKTTGEILLRWFVGGSVRTPDTDWAAFAPYTARAMTHSLCDAFDRAVESSGAKRASDHAPCA